MRRCHGLQHLTDPKLQALIPPRFAVQDLMMEIERIKALEQYEARELQRNEERRRGAKVLEDQIAQREFERLRQVRATRGCRGVLFVRVGSLLQLGGLAGTRAQ